MKWRVEVFGEQENDQGVSISFQLLFSLNPSFPLFLSLSIYLNERKRMRERERGACEKRGSWRGKGMKWRSWRGKRTRGKGREKSDRKREGGRKRNWGNCRWKGKGCFSLKIADSHTCSLIQQWATASIGVYRGKEIAVMRQRRRDEKKMNERM